MRFHSTLTVFERIEQKFIPEPNSGCWLWIGSVSTGGYGLIGLNKKVRPAHRILYEQKFGPIPVGLEIDHLCRTRCCVNPDHLEAVTRRENIMRGLGPSARQAKQTHCKNGHPLAGENLVINKGKYGPMRQCKTCRLEYLNKNRERRNAQSRAYYYSTKEK